MDEKILNKIDNYLRKKSHVNYFAIKLVSYNNNYLYIRFDYDKRINAYKIIWYDLKYINVKQLDIYTNSQMVTSFLANKMVECLYKIKRDSVDMLDYNIFGDRVEIINAINKDNIRTYRFDRFLPLEWKEFIDPLALIFTYLPRSMELILNEVFGKFDKAEEYYNSRKPIRFNLEKDNIDDLFKRNNVIKGRRLEDRVEFLELVEGKYIGVVDDKELVVVVVEEVTQDFYNMWTSLNSPYLNEYIYAVLQCIKDKKFNDFYKVKYKDKNRNLLDQLRIGQYYLACGVDEDCILVITREGTIAKIPIRENNKCVIRVIEDDDNLSLSKILKDYE